MTRRRNSRSEREPAANALAPPDFIGPVEPPMIGALRKQRLGVVELMIPASKNVAGHDVFFDYRTWRVVVKLYFFECPECLYNSEEAGWLATSPHGACPHCAEFAFKKTEMEFREASADEIARLRAERAHEKEPIR